MHLGRRWSFACFTADGNGTKQFGVAVWGNGQRLGFEIHFWRWELQIMMEKS